VKEKIMDKEQIPDVSQIKSTSLSRRSLLQGAACAGSAATILAVTANRAAAAKMKQSAVGYTGSSPKPGQNCANCGPFQPPNACRIVEGNISPQGWCKVWQRKPA
jgi:High potential iron-sulfur protein